MILMIVEHAFDIVVVVACTHAILLSVWTLLSIFSLVFLLFAQSFHGFLLQVGIELLLHGEANLRVGV